MYLIAAVLIIAGLLIGSATKRAKQMRPPRKAGGPFADYSRFDQDLQLRNRSERWD
jgi:hypothetical protein